MAKISDYINQIIQFINGTLVPLIFAVAFIVFLFGVYRYMIQGADNPEMRQKGGQFIMFSLIGFFVMISIWGLVNLLLGTFGLDYKSRPCLPTFSKDANCTDTPGGGSTPTSPTSPTTPASPTTPTPPTSPSAPTSFPGLRPGGGPPAP